MNKLLIILSLIPALGLVEESRGQIRMPAIFSDHMVLQREIKLPCWGSAREGSRITIEIAGNTAFSYADEDGKWMVCLPEMKAGGPYEMKVTGDQSLTFTDVMIGDVWLASGQSNMDFPLADAKNGGKDVSEADFPEIRLFTVKNELSVKPKEQVTGGPWIKCDSSSVKRFSAVAFYFGREIHLDQKVAIGLIQDSWSGTVCEAWASQELLRTIPVMKQRIADFKQRNITDDSININVEKDNNNWLLAANSFEGLKKHVQTNHYSDRDWKTMTIPKAINESGIGSYEGIIWFRKSIELPSGYKGRDLQLKMGKIDLAAVVYFNGVRIGETSWNYDKYITMTVPGKFVNKGENLIVIRLLDSWGKGGLLGPADSMYMKTDNPKEKVCISLAGEWKYNNSLEPAFAKVENFNRVPGLIYNAKIAPIIPYGIKGVIWYQGEGNAGRAYQYRTLFPLLISDWRTRWRQGYFPFLFVQLPGYSSDQYQNEYEWAELREAQLLTLSHPNTGMAVTIDLDEKDNLHPTNKNDVGKRLAIAARKIAYNEDVVYSGPIYENMQIEGNAIRIRFANAGSGLISINGQPLQGFEIAGEDQKFYNAEASVVKNEVVVFSSEVPYPVAVRYAWANNPLANLKNREGLPASPFRTDNWKGVTDTNE